ncbi:MAG: hypothetical protein PHI85_04080 [Victivallaceae bacterium]|nr:hypothetical protein [Victivallaceae bacterium]
MIFSAEDKKVQYSINGKVSDGYWPSRNKHTCNNINETPYAILLQQVKKLVPACCRIAQLTVEEVACCTEKEWYGNAGKHLDKPEIHGRIRINKRLSMDDNNQNGT